MVSEAGQKTDDGPTKRNAKEGGRSDLREFSLKMHRRPDKDV
jgi:hypothetical protein